MAASALKKLLDFRKPQRMTVEEYLQKLTEKGLNEDGTQKLDPTPMAPPIGYKKAPSMVEIVRDMVRGERLRQEALQTGHETFEEAEDFDVDDDPEQLRSPYENDFDPPLGELLQAGEAETRRKKAIADAGGVPEPKKTPEVGGAGGKPPAEGSGEA